MKKIKTTALSFAMMALCTFALFAQTGNTQKMQKAADKTISIVGNATFSNTQKPSVFSTIPIDNRGNIAQAMHLYPVHQHDSWDIDAPNATTYMSSFAISMRGGEFYNGIWYCYDGDKNYYNVDPATGIVLKKIPNATSVVCQDLAYNYATNTMYGISSNVLYSMNMESGAATQVAALSSVNTMMTLAIDLTGNAFGISADDGNLYNINLTSGLCTLVGATGRACAYVQSMGFDHNTEILYWGQCSALDDMNFCVVDATTGNAATIASGFGEINGFFVPYYQNQNVASAPTNFTITPDADMELSATLSWTNPTTTVGNEFLTSISAVKIFRNGELIHTVTNMTPGASETWVDNTISVPESYTYYICAVNAAGDGMISSAFATVGPTCTVTVYGHDSQGDGWDGAYINFVDAAGNSRGTFAVSGFETTADVVFPSGCFINCVWVQGEYDLEVDGITLTDQEGTVLYQSLSAPSGNFFSFTNNCSQEVPNPPTNFVVTPNSAMLTNTLTWTNPSTCLNGSPANMTSAVIMRDDQTIHTIINPQSGANETYVDQLLEPGIYAYTVYVTNEHGNSSSVSSTVIIGGSYQMEFGQTVEITTCSGMIYDNGGANGTYAANSNDIMIIYPDSEGSTIAINGTFAIETNYDFLYVYEGAGIEGTLLNTYSYSNGGTVGDVSTTGPLTLRFTSDGSIQKSGFSIVVSCTAPTSVSGNVAELATGMPIEGASVNFIGVGGATAVTDAQGNYSTSLLMGIYDIRVEAVGYNAIMESDFVISDAGVSGKNFAMTSPGLLVTPDSVFMTIPYLGTATAEVTVTNTGNGPLTYLTESEYEGRSAIEGISYEEYLRLAGDLPENNSPRSAGKAPNAKPAYIYNPITFRGENSTSLIALNGTDLRKFILNNPAETTPLATGLEFMNSAEYVNGTFYFASAISGYFGTINIESGTMNIISAGNPYGSIAYNQMDGEMYGISLANGASTIYRVDMETGASTAVSTCPMGYVLGMAINNDGRFFVIDVMANGICEVNPATGAYINVLSPGFSINYGQDITCDHNENEIYWAAFNGSANAAQLYHIDVDEEVFTLLGTFESQASCFAIEGPSGWLQSNPVTNVIAAQSSETVTLTADGSQGLLPGTYQATVHFNTKDPNVGSEDVAVTLVVEEAACGSPQNLFAIGNQEDTTISLQWDAVQDAISYTVYLNTEEVITGLTTTSAIIDNINVEVEYCIEVVAVCSEGVGIPSNEACVTIPAPDPPTVDIIIDEVTETTVSASFDANEACYSYYILIGIQSEMEMWMQMMQMTLEQLIQLWGIHAYSDTSYVWTSQTPNTEYTIYALPMDIGGLSYTLQTQTVTTLGGGGQGEAIVTVELSEITASSVRMVVTPNENTSVFHDGLITVELFNQVGQDSAIEIIKNNQYPLYETDDWIWTDLQPNTAYKAIGIGKNANDEWGSPTINEFSTLQGGGCDAPTVTAEPSEYEGEPAILLTWTVVEGASLYTIYYGTESLGTNSSNSTYITGIEIGVEYCFTVTATCDGIESEHSNEACAIISAGTTYTIIASAGENGTITPSGSILVEEGSSKTFNMEANEGYQIENVVVDGASMGVLESYTFENVTANHTISVSFEVKPAVSELDVRFKVYPNPADNQVSIDGENIESIAVYNVLGQMVENIKVASSTSHDINTASYESGVYVVRIVTTDGSVSSKRVVIAH